MPGHSVTRPILPRPPSPTLAVLRKQAAQLRLRPLRSIREFAEAEVVIPTGPFAGRRFRCDRQPFARLWLDAIDSGLWRRFAFTGGQQGGKTLNGSVIPVMYHLFEVGETVIYGVPTLDMVQDKWEEDLLPAIQASRYRELLPRSGQGSRGGRVTSRVNFRNGAALRFMTGGPATRAARGSPRGSSS
jgi:hypothetical protein